MRDARILRRLGGYVKGSSGMIPSMLTRLFVPLVLVLLAVSCGGGGSDGSEAPSPTPGIALDPISAAAVDLAERFGLSADDVDFVSSTSTQWPDSCLGLPEPDEVCAQVVTPGYEVVLAVDGVNYTYHTNLATEVRAVDGGAEPD